MESQGPRWIDLAAAAGRYDQGTMTVSLAGDHGTPAYLISLVRAKVLAGRVADPTGVEIQLDALDRLVELDLESHVRRELDEEEDAS